MAKLFFIILILGWNCDLQSIFHSPTTNFVDKDEAMKKFYDFEVIAIDGTSFDLNQLKGKRVLIVNTASECGYTPQYAQLQELYDKYKDKNFVILGFPANNFGGQEPGSNSDIVEFCQKNYGVEFPMMEKVSVKGEDAHPLFLWLTQKAQNSVSDAEIGWNFNKFLIDEKGQWVAHYPSRVEPLDPVIIEFASGK